MSLWTPGGEHPVDRKHENTSFEITPDVRAALAEAGVDVDALTPEQQQQALQMLTEMAQAREQLLSVPASDVIANHVMGLYELGAIHLGENPPHFAESAIAIEAIRGVLERCEGKLGENEPVLRQALAQLQTSFVQLKEHLESQE